MKIKNIITVLITIALLFILAGCQLAKENLDGVSFQDRLIGVFVIADRPDGFDDRLYAKSVDGKYIFEGIEGIAYYSADVIDENGEVYSLSYSDEGFSESDLSIHVGDEEEKTLLNVRVYLAPKANKNDEIIQYVNPVYQSKDGKVYAEMGAGMAATDPQTEGDIFSTKLEDTVTYGENGREKSITTSINLAFEIKMPPQEIVIMEMDKDSNIIKKQGYEPGKLPNSISPDINAEYFIVESYKIDFDGKEKVDRSIFSREAESLDSYYANDKGFVIKQITEIKK